MANKDDKPENIGDLAKNNANQGEIDSDKKVLNIPMISPQMLSDSVDKIIAKRKTVPTSSSKIKFLNRKCELAEQNLMFVKEKHKKSNDFLKLNFHLIKLAHKNNAELHDELKAMEEENSKISSITSQLENELETQKRIIPALINTVALKREEIKFLDQNMEELDKVNKQNDKLLIKKDQQIAKLDKKIAQLKLKLKHQLQCNPSLQDEGNVHNLPDPNCTHCKKN